MSAQGIDAAARAADVSEEQLQHRRGANNLRAEAVLGPTDGVNNRAGLFHVAVFSNRGIQFGGFEKLISGDTGDALDHLRRVA